VTIVQPFGNGLKLAPVRLDLLGTVVSLMLMPVAAVLARGSTTSPCHGPGGWAANPSPHRLADGSIGTSTAQLYTRRSFHVRGAARWDRWRCPPPTSRFEGSPLRAARVGSIPRQLAEALRERYVLESELGRWGMATVYLAHYLKHDRFAP
jgi:hypothetical protein